MRLWRIHAWADRDPAMGVFEAVIILTLGLASVLSLTIKFLPAGKSFMQGGLKESATDNRDVSYSRLQFVTYRGQFGGLPATVLSAS
jgi:hypothetical protein